MSNYSVLVVDDQPENFEVLEALLGSMNYTLHYSSSSKAAISSLNKIEPDLILLDVMMPEIDGIEVCKQIKANPQWQAIPIIMITSLYSTEDLACCLTAGADDFLSKPVNGIELRARVQSMLRIKKQHDRIESLSKLQRNSISSLKSSLNELNTDLAVSFPKESDAPLHNILDNIRLLQQDFHKMSLPKIRAILESVNQSAIELDQFHQRFLFSRQLSTSVPESEKWEACNAKISIEQIATRQIDQLDSPLKLIFDIEDADLAVAPKHLQYIIVELLDYVLKISQPQGSIHMHGYIMNDEFHFCIDNRGIDISRIPLEELAFSIKFEPASYSENEITTGLTIARKIIEIHKGMFLISHSELTKATIYITLPLIRSVLPAKPSLLLVTNNDESISDELQASFYQYMC